MRPEPPGSERPHVARLLYRVAEVGDAPDFRVTIEPQPENGLRLKSQVMAVNWMRTTLRFAQICAK